MRQAADQQRRLDEMLEKLEVDALSKIQEPIGQRRVEEFLATSILPSQRRIPLLKALQELSKPKAADTAGQTSGDTQSAASGGSSGTKDNGRGSADGHAGPGTQVQFDWSRVQACLELEERLIRLIDERTATSIEQDIREMAKHSQLSTESESFPAEFWDNYRHAVSAIKAFYTRIPRATENAFTLQLVDARDATLVDAKQYPLARFRIELDSTAELQLEPIAQALRLDDQFQAKLGVTLVTNKQNLLDSRVALTNSDGILAFELLPEFKELPTERGLYRKTMFWRVSARKESIRDGKIATTVRLASKYGPSEATSSIEIQLPQPNRVDVYFDRISVPTQAGGQSSTIGLQLFPNRTTRFICSLSNQYDQPKTVEVFIYAIAPRPLARTPIGKLDDYLHSTVYDDASRVYLNPTLLAKSAKPIELPAAAPGRGAPIRIPIDLVGPQAAPPPTPQTRSPPRHHRYKHCLRFQFMHWRFASSTSSNPAVIHPNGSKLLRCRRMNI